MKQKDLEGKRTFPDFPKYALNAGTDGEGGAETPGLSLTGKPQRWEGASTCNQENFPSAFHGVQHLIVD